MIITLICVTGSNEVTIADHESQQIPGTLAPSPAVHVESIHKPVAAKQIASIRVTTLLVSLKTQTLNCIFIILSYVMPGPNE